MSFSIVLDYRAIEDIQKAIEYYDDKSPGLGAKFERSIDQHLGKLKTNPFFQIRYDEVRCLPLKKYPYMIHYTVDEDAKLVIVRAVLNTNRDPRLWNERR